jgi:hypothetical protein
LGADFAGIRAVGMSENGVTHTSPSRYDRCSSWQKALLLALSLRVVYSLVAVVIALVQPVNWRLVQSNALTENLPPPNHSLGYLLLGVWERFDTLWYLRIAGQGYDRPESVVFFPLYPWLIRAASVVLQPMVAALLISTVAAFFLFWGLHELLLPELSPELAERSVLICVVWPASFIFFAGYPESLLFALIVWSICMARTDRWLLAAALGVAAALTKAVGIVVLVPLLILAIHRKKVVAWTVMAVPLGSAGFMIWLHSIGHRSITAAYQQYWRTSTALPWTTLWTSLRTLIRTPNPVLVLNLAFLTAACVLVARSRLRMEYVLYAVAAILVFLTKETEPPLQSTVRYLLIVFPSFVGLSRFMQAPLLRPRFGMACVAMFVINLGLLWLFLGWSLVL